ncbi:23S rRNA (uracil(1939)-C(5))-methyltransferase RlmD [Lacrimispora sp.]|uniref:23S rRNA (uracil(1939)-C(5))-methyltransferase RlmD n=1 Tax=Lacrimispora sp. TaxID=2719234 RepID=UPI0028A8158C|nr:23S rRNA (uracil(1939)-C(5))-methyltransferase RlmD [Lacrimispora sp.]
MDSRNGNNAGGSKSNSRNSGRNDYGTDSRDSGRTGYGTDSRDRGRTGYSTDSRDRGRTGYGTDSRNSGRNSYSTDSRNSGRNDYGTDSRNSGRNGYGTDSRNSGRNGYGTDSRNSGKNGYSTDRRNSGRNGYSTDRRDSSKNGYSTDSRDSGKNGYGTDSRNGGRNGYSADSRNNSRNDSSIGSKKGHSGNMPNRTSREKRSSSKCPVSRICGGCQLLDMPYEKQLEQKQKYLEKLLKPYCHVAPIIGMENPNHYRNKVHAVFDHDKKGNPVSGVYEANSHRVVPVENCMIEDQKADEIIGTIRGMLKSFKIRTYDEDSGYGLLRHVLIRRGFTTGEVMVVLVTASPIFPSKNNFVKALREKHPEITTIIQNVNGRETSMVLGDKEHVLYGKGYIEDILCGCRFHISSKSFYQVNPVQTEILYNKAIKAAGLTGKERVVDAYCGIGTIGIVASKYAKEVIGVELNRDAVRDAVENAKINGIKNVKFFCNDAGKFMVNMAENGEHVDVVFMDPPRSGSTEEFIDSVAKMKPDKVVYVSCGPETLARDLEYFKKKGYEAKMGWGVDLFPATEHCEICVEICRTK